MKGILFNQDMVKAILDGRKSVTRRVLKPQPHIFCEGLENECKHPTGFFDTGNNEWACRRSGCGIRMNGTSIYHAPYQVGDILYVRETWNRNPLNEYGNEIEKYVYKATYDGHAGEFGWHPSIHMPREAARIFLKVTNVRVERLQDITDEQAINEGFDTRDCFINAILKMYPDATLDSYFWVIDFERISKEEAYAEKN